jgi:hypothetical protein
VIVIGFQTGIHAYYTDEHKCEEHATGPDGVLELEVVPPHPLFEAQASKNVAIALPFQHSP